MNDRLLGHSLGFHKLDQLVPSHLGDVQSLQLLTVPVHEDELGGLARNLLEDGIFVLGLEVLVDEFLHLGELVQSSSGARLDPGGEDGRVLTVGLILMNKTKTLLLRSIEFLVQSTEYRIKWFALIK